MTSFRIAATVAAALWTTGAVAAPITYVFTPISAWDFKIDRDTGSAVAPPPVFTGSLTTDGTIGVLSAVNILSWSFTISDTTGAETFDSAGSLGGMPAIVGAEYIEATPTELLLSYVPNGDLLRFSNGMVDGGGMDLGYWQLLNSGFAVLTNEESTPPGIDGAFGQLNLGIAPGGQTAVAAAAAAPPPIPLPPAGALALAGLAALAAIRRRR